MVHAHSGELDLQLTHCNSVKESCLPFTMCLPPTELTCCISSFRIHKCSSSGAWDSITYRPVITSISAALVEQVVCARVGRHLRGDSPRRWHIDYLRAVAEVQNVLYTVTDAPLECAWSQALAHLPNAFIPVPLFGASDCRSGCGAHLIGFSRRADINCVPRALAQITPTPIGSLRPR
jgi:Uri superfamily endonuclease